MSLIIGNNSLLANTNSFISQSLQKKITLNANKVSLRYILNEIQKQSNIGFVFKYEKQLELLNDLSVNFTDISVEDALNEVLRKTQFTYRIVNNTVTITEKKDVSLADIKIKGKVIDAETKKGIAGATVLVLGTQTGAITDDNGDFSLSVKEGNELEISFIGMKTAIIRINDSNKKEYEIELQPDLQVVNDVVVVGYGTRKKEHVTGAIEVIKGQELAQQATNRLDEAIMGQTAGVFVANTSGDPSALGEVVIRIRGNKYGVSGEGAPLLVIDGTPRFGNFISDGEMRLSDINPNDVESISILKDAAAAAIYGSRAANGVILVTTKRGNAMQKLSIRYSGKGNFQQAAMMPNFLNNYEFAKLFNTAVENTKGTQVKPYTEEQLQQIKDGSNPDIYASEDLTSYLKKWGYSTSHSLSLSGGSNNISYYTSGSYTSTSGLYDGVKNNRYNYNLRLDAKLLDGLSLSFDVMGSGSSSKNPSYQTISSLYNFSPLQPLIWSDGSWVSIGGSNPLVGINGLGGYSQNKSNYSTVTARLDYELNFITKGLNIYAKASFDNNLVESRKFSTPVKLYNREVSVVDDIEQVSYVLDQKTVYPKGKTSIEQRMQKANNKLLEAGINYNRDFNQHNVSAMLLFNYQDSKSTNMRAENKEMQTTYPEFVGTSGNIGGATDSYNQRASMVGRLNYSYASRYVFEASFRYDGSTKFHPDNRWGFFPTASVAWNLSNENFFTSWKQNILSNAKFRVSTGLLGNDGSIGNFSYLYNYFLGNQSYQIGSSAELAGLMFDTSNIPNSILQWGKSQDYNVGVDLGFFRNRLTINYEYYWRFNTNDIRETPAHLYPPSLGTNGSTPYQNFGKTKTWGYDLTVGWRDKAVRDLSYSIDIMLSRSWDKVIDAGDESALSEERRKAGKPINSSWMYMSDGLFQNQAEIDAHPVDQDGKGNKTLIPGDIRYKDFNGDNILGEDDKRAVEYLNIPAFALNFKVGLNYKGIFVNALFQGAFNYKKDVSDSYTLEDGSLPRFQDYHLKDSWSPTNTSGSYPVVKIASKVDNNRRSSDYWYRNASYLRLRTLNIGYSLPSRYLKSVKLSSLSIGLQGGNLFTISSLKGIDPDTERGYPITRTYGVTINLGF